MKQELFDKLIHLKKAADALAKDQNRLAMEQLSNTEQLKRLIIQLDHTLESARESVEILPPPLPKIVQNPVPKPDLEGIGAVSPKTETPKPEIPKVEVPKAEIPEPKPSKPEPSKPERKIDWEKFIGENLMSKLGIVIILIGVAIFGKYAIDNDLISPLGRILCGAGLGVAFIGTGLWLKKSVENLSAILVAGGTAVLYLMTYFAYDFYQMMPMVAAGALMLAISAFTFWSAIFYKKEVIAIYGQLCSYVIPLVISNGTGNLLNFLTYIVIINAVITALAVVYKWKKAYGLSFIITSGVVLWINSKYNATADFAKLIVLISLNMLIYYVSMAWIKAKEGGWLASYDSLMVVTQTLLFFVVGYHQAWMDSGFSGGKLTVVLITFAVNALLAA
ncbi:MAG: DUF2339 domain-containing protein, partial [Bacteroidales bacterium]|nr:DUF2339 domain-containing protein [Bacteroidales bacterium]